MKLYWTIIQHYMYSNEWKRNVLQLRVCVCDRMDSFVVAETFKYLYLLFSDKDDLIIDVNECVCDRMDSFVLAETFKYLYLLFSDKDDLIIDVNECVCVTEWIRLLLLRRSSTCICRSLTKTT